MYRWGIIGVSEGNGHPYSWSAIVNGYDPRRMEECGYPVIPRYLEQHETPDARLQGYQVSSVYTEDADLSESIAQTCQIPHVASSLQDLAKSVDGIIVARDDAETHLEFAQTLAPFGKPVFFDKPLAFTSNEADMILSLETYEGQLWSASGLSFEPSVNWLAEQEQLRGVIAVDAHISGPWKRYAVHLVEPLIKAGVTNPNLQLVFHTSTDARKSALYESRKDNDDLYVRISCWSKKKYSVPPTLSVLHADGTNSTVVLTDTYEAFTRLLQEFAMICDNRIEADISPMLGAIKLIESVSS